MHAKTIILSTLAALAAAAPTTDSNAPFAAIASHSGSGGIGVHQRGISANGRFFYLNKASSAYCPEGVEGLDCSKFGNATVFGYNQAGSVYMDVNVPGGQRVYVESGGALGYTQAHSGAIPEGSLTDGFSYTPQSTPGSVGTLSFNGDGFLACPTGVSGDSGEVYQVFAAAEFSQDRTDCIGFGFATAEYSGPIAWQY